MEMPTLAAQPRKRRATMILRTARLNRARPFPCLGKARCSNLTFSIVTGTSFSKNMVFHLSARQPDRRLISPTCFAWSQRTASCTGVALSLAGITRSMRQPIGDLLDVEDQLLGSCGRLCRCRLKYTLQVSLFLDQ